MLRRLGVEPIDAVDEVEPPGGVYGRGGESPERKALKSYVLNNPHAVGLSEHVDRVAEYPFPSVDAVDVLFKSVNCGWRRKSNRTSDGMVKDYERGLYQCVKHRPFWTLCASIASMRYLIELR